jgi:tRNA(fMet)-specific endonuclease VapC
MPPSLSPGCAKDTHHYAVCHAPDSMVGEPCGPIDLRADLERRGTPIGSLDTIFAAHALKRHAMLVTNNTREFAKVPGLQLDNWVSAT